MITGVFAERILWRAVILQAILDLVSPVTSAEDRIHRDEACCWLFEQNDDFASVCDRANLDPQILRESLRERLHSSPPDTASVTDAAQDRENPKGDARDLCYDFHASHSMSQHVRLDPEILRERLRARLCWRVVCERKNRANKNDNATCPCHFDGVVT